MRRWDEDRRHWHTKWRHLGDCPRTRDWGPYRVRRALPDTDGYSAEETLQLEELRMVTLQNDCANPQAAIRQTLHQMSRMVHPPAGWATFEDLIYCHDLHAWVESELVSCYADGMHLVTGMTRVPELLYVWTFKNVCTVSFITRNMFALYREPDTNNLWFVQPYMHYRKIPLSPDYIDAYPVPFREVSDDSTLAHPEMRISRGFYRMWLPTYLPLMRMIKRLLAMHASGAINLSSYRLLVACDSLSGICGTYSAAVMAEEFRRAGVTVDMHLLLLRSPRVGNDAFGRYLEGMMRVVHVVNDGDAITGLPMRSAGMRTAGFPVFQQLRAEMKVDELMFPRYLGHPIGGVMHDSSFLVAPMWAWLRRHYRSGVEAFFRGEISLRQIRSH